MSRKDAPSGTLLDEQTGKRTVLRRANCRAIAIGGPWILFDCYPHTPRIQLYRIATGHWQPVDVSIQSSPVFVGADWIQLHVTSGPSAYAFYNIGTGRERTLDAWHRGGRTIPDLNSPALARILCEPLRVPDAWNDTGEAEWPGTVTFDGSFAVAQGTTRPDATGRFSEFAYLERCGTHLHRWIAGMGPGAPLVGNPHAIIWEPSEPGPNPNLQGMFLPASTGFTVNTRNLIGDNQYRIFLTTRTLYVLTPSPPPSCPGHESCTPQPKQLWAAPSPTPPRSSRR
jgi:hypothetical protein